MVDPYTSAIAIEQLVAQAQSAPGGGVIAMWHDLTRYAGQQLRIHAPRREPE